MENASKALIMAGGMLLAILIISLLIYAWSLFSKYQSSQDDLANIEDTAKFNEQFANYDRDGIQGYELLSLVNKVIDYNYRSSNAEGAKNDDKYKKITIKITFENGNNNKLTKDGTNRVFKSASYTQSDTNNTFKDIISEMGGIESRYGGADYATKLAKGIDGIILSNDQLRQNREKGISDTDSKNTAVKKFNSSSNNQKYNDYSDYSTMVTSERENLYKYYEYMQFKRALFNSVANSVTYDDATGRITKMEFKFTGKLY